jgi:hypothetical protein
MNLLKHDFATPTLDLATPDVGSASPTGLTPIQIRGAYGLNLISGDGNNQTIAIIDAYDDPNALSDLQHFDAQFSLPDPPSFQKLNQDGTTSPLPGTDPSGPYSVSHANMPMPWRPPPASISSNATAPVTVICCSAEPAPQRISPMCLPSP